jgi:hypothetical protein
LITKARILLKADTSDAGEGWTDGEIAAALDTSVNTVGSARRQLVEEGFEPTLVRKYNPNSARPRIFEGATEAKLIALACSRAAPTGKRRLVTAHTLNGQCGSRLRSPVSASSRRRRAVKSHNRTCGHIFPQPRLGMGAVVGALNVSALRARIADEIAIRLCVIVMGAGVATVAMSRSRLLTAGALLFAGAAWTASVTLFNVGVQLAAPRWVAGRALAAYQAAIAGGIAIGSWVWGSTASLIGVKGALLISGAALVASSALGLWMRMPTISGPNELSLDIPPDPELRLSLTPRSGPIVIEIEYRVAPARARLFYAVMQQVQHSRQRNGAYGWSIARDIADPELWTERFHCPTWHDYLRQRNRSTESERALHIRATDFHMGPEPIRIRRMLERPIGSVRWKDETPDRSITDHAPIAGPGSGA